MKFIVLGLVVAAISAVDARKKKCLMEEVALAGPDLKVLDKIPDLNDCQNRCEQTGLCQYFTYFPDVRRCHLKEKKAVNGMAYFRINAVSGPKTCCDQLDGEHDCCELHRCLTDILLSPCITPNMGFSKDAFEIPTATLRDCKDLCDTQKPEVCRYYEFNGKTCKLFEPQDSSKRVEKKSVVVGIRSCGVGENVYYDGPTLMITDDLMTWPECQVLCLRTPTCLLWQMKRESQYGPGRCELKDHFTDSHYEPQTFSGKRHTCFENGVVFTGTARSPWPWNEGVSIFETYEQCQTSCNKECQTWEFNTETKICKHYVEKGLNMWAPDDRYITGMDTCGLVSQHKLLGEVSYETYASQNAFECMRSCQSEPNRDCQASVFTPDRNNACTLLRTITGREYDPKVDSYFVYC